MNRNAFLDLLVDEWYCKFVERHGNTNSDTIVTWSNVYCFFGPHALTKTKVRALGHILERQGLIKIEKLGWHITKLEVEVTT